MRRENVRARGLARWMRVLGAGIGSRMVALVGRWGSKVWRCSWSDLHDWRECVSTGALGIGCKPGEMFVCYMHRSSGCRCSSSTFLVPSTPTQESTLDTAYKMDQGVNTRNSKSEI